MQTPTSRAGYSKPPLTKESKELRDRCLDDGRLGEHTVARQWQRFGKFTADLLKNEVCAFETKLEILQDSLEKLSRENAELRDVCLFMNQMSSPGRNSESAWDTPKPSSSSSDSAPAQSYAVHSSCAAEMNKLSPSTGESPPSHEKAEESGSKDDNQEKGDTSYISELEKRVERLEAEKLEIMKSLALAYTLPHTTSCPQSLDEAPAKELDLDLKSPPDVHAFLEFIEDSGGGMTLSKEELQQACSTETILGMVTLLNLSRRLDALRLMPIKDPQEKAEINILSTLTTVAWKQLTKTLEDSHQLLKQPHEREDKRKEPQPYRHKYSNFREKKYGSSAKVLRTEL